MTQVFADAITRLPLAAQPDRGAAALTAAPWAVGTVARLIEGAAGSSPYLAGLIAREAAWLEGALAGRGAAAAADPVAAKTAGLAGVAADALADPVAAETAVLAEAEPAALGPALRRAKRRVSLIAALADLGGVWPLQRVTGALTDLADRAVDLAFRAHLRAEAAKGRMPATGADAAGLIVLAMGKMGAGELNYSSDIDLIVLYDDDAYAPADRADARAGLIRVTRRAVATLSDMTAEGYVFRTDLRLRPDASVTPVCLSASAALDYYEAEGRTWERAAYIKARPCAGDLAAGDRFLAGLRPFVWRKHLDYAAIDDAHAMRLRIRDHKGLNGRIEAAGHNMKLGQGGIREIEFFTQTRQLIAGGRDERLRQRATVPALRALARAGWVPEDVAAELADAYGHHREVEHRIQMVNDSQTHSLPPAGPALDAVARLSGAADTPAWAAAITARLGRVEALTGAFFAPGPADERPPLSPAAEGVIARWPSYPALRSERAQQVFARIEARLLGCLGRAADPDAALARFDSFLAQLPAGVQVFSLFEQNPQLMDLVADICGTAPGLAGYFAQHPGVLDAVIAGQFFADWPGVAALSTIMRGSLDAAISAPGGGYERGLDTARRLVHDWQFRIGVHHLRGLIGAEEAAIQYSDLADALIGALFALVTQHFAQPHGPPPGRGAVVLAMGSLGARRLNARSDLDLIVIYDAAGMEASQGAKPLAARTYYARLTQALLTALTAPTAEGRLYEADMRLRPSGRQGPVATSMAAFRDYQLTEAWTWEHLALTRGRVVAVCGPDGGALGDDVEALRRMVLAQRGTDPRVLPDLEEMRQRLFAARPGGGPAEVKAGPGRLQDIDLIAQSLALRGANPARDTVAQLQAGGRAGLMAAADVGRLIGAQRFLWSVQGALRLVEGSSGDVARVPETLGAGALGFVLREAGEADLAALTARIAAETGTAAAAIGRALAGGAAG